MRDQLRQGLKVVGHPPHDLLLCQPLGQRNLDDAVKRQNPLVYLVQAVYRASHPQVAADHRSAEPLSVDLAHRLEESERALVEYVQLLGRKE